MSSCHVRSSSGSQYCTAVGWPMGAMGARAPHLRSFTYVQVLDSYVEDMHVQSIVRLYVVPPRPSHPDIKEGICAEMRRTPTAAGSTRTRRNNDADGRDPAQNSLLHRPVTQFHPDVSKPGTSAGKPSRTSLRWAFLPGLPALAGYWYFYYQ